MKKRMLNVVMTGALAASVFGVASLPAFAASSTALDNGTQQKVETIMDNLRTKLSNLGVDLPEKRSPFNNLDAETKAKAEAIWEKKKAGTITDSEAQTQLKAIGVTLPERGNHLESDVANASLSKVNQAKADAILKKVEAGTLTHDEAETQLKALGVTISERGGKGGNHLESDVANASLSKANQAKADAILKKVEAGTLTHDEAETQLKALGVTISERGGKESFLSGLDEATKAKAEAIFEKRKAGTITHDEAETQLKALGVTLPERGGKGGRGENMLQGLDDETKAQAESLIEDAQEQLEDLGVDKVPGMKMN